MYQQQRVLALIPARGNSKGVPRKNVLPLGGKPLIGWSIDAARESESIDEVFVSTDCEEIAGISRTCGAEVPFLRPANLAMDDTPGVSVALHACEALPGFDILVLLQPTSPLRTATDIDRAVQTLVDRNAAFCVGVTPPKHHPNWLYREQDDGTLNRYESAGLFPGRQQLSPLLALNGAIYVAKVADLMEQRTLIGCPTVAYRMPPERSIDIDRRIDFALCEFMLSYDGDVE